MHCGILMSTFFGCRLASIFDIRVKAESWNPDIPQDTVSNGKDSNMAIENGINAQASEDNDSDGLNDFENCDDVELLDEDDSWWMVEFYDEGNYVRFLSMAAHENVEIE